MSGIKLFIKIREGYFQTAEEHPILSSQITLGKSSPQRILKGLWEGLHLKSLYMSTMMQELFKS